MNQRETLQLALEALEVNLGTWSAKKKAIPAIKEALAKPDQKFVEWRDHVEQRLLTWRQSFVNRSGDQLGLDDFMDKRSLDDLIEFVCDEYATPPQPEPVIDKSAATRIATSLGWEPKRKPLTDEQKVALCKQFPDHLTFNAIHAIEAAHDIKE